MTDCECVDGTRGGVLDAHSHSTCFSQSPYSARFDTIRDDTDPVDFRPYFLDKMARKEQRAAQMTDGNSATHASILNFQYSRSQQQQNVHNRRYQRLAITAQRNTGNRSDKPATRTRQSGTFYLHSSPKHAFILTRVPSRLEQTTFSNSDAPVSWNAVRLVKYYSSVNDSQDSCPICLECFTCPRITKCGHCFCLPCLVHHVYSSERLVDKAPKCPCCAMPLCLSDVRPVLLQSTLSPALHKTMRFVKLARLKHCSSPYLPRPDAPRRVSAHAAPCMDDMDAPYCRFNFLDPQLYQDHLRQNIKELLNSASTKDGSHDDGIFSTMALDMVQDELRRAALEEPDERQKMEQFTNPAAGICQGQLGYNRTVGSGSDADVGRRFLSVTGSTEGPSSLVEPPRFTRSRSDSVVSHDSRATANSDASDIYPKHSIGGSMYSEPDEHVFYQAEDGTLCFLNGFNMKCLQAQFATFRSEDPRKTIAATPLPDLVQGRVLEVERVLLTQEKRQRFKFLSHLPVNSEICFIELNLGHLLNKQTKKEHQKEFNKRKQKRINKLHAEKSAEERERLKEEARINKLKLCFQKVNPDDVFFHPPEPEPPVILTGEAFGPTVSSSSAAVSQISAHNHSGSAFSFSQIIQTKPGLRSYDFPALGGSLGNSHSLPTMAPVSPSQWAPSISNNESVRQRANTSLVNERGKSTTGKNTVFFSVGGHLGGFTS